MNRLCRKSISLLLSLLLSASLALPALAVEQDPAALQIASAQDAAEGALQYGSAVSVQYALWDNGSLTLSGHVGDYSKTENRALTDDILYGAGSVSKLYTTAAVLQLAQANKLLLDAPVTRYLPSFRMADSRYRDITVRMLLNHSSGLMGSTFQNALLFDDADASAADTLLEKLQTQRLKADPGACSVYCNDGFTLAELVVEAVSEQPFMDYVRAHLLSPAGLSDTFAPSDDFDESRLARTYHGSDLRALPRDCLGVVGAGGLYATASDLAAFGGALTNDTLLNARSRAAMAAPEYDRGIWPEDTSDALSFGLGWDSVSWFPFSQSGIQALVKGGDTLSYHAGLIVLPDYHLAAAVVSSGGSSTCNELAATRLLLDALSVKGVQVDETIPSLEAAKPASMPAELLENAGYYAATAAQYRIVLSQDGALTLDYLNLDSIPPQTFTYFSDGTFRDSTGTAAMRFVKEENGKTYLYQKTVAALPGLGALPVSNYAAVKLPENAVSPEVQAFWEQMAATSVVPLGEKYTSQVYLSLSDASAGQTLPSIPGYIGGNRIVDANAALYELEIPGSAGRDGQDLTISQQDGNLYFSAGGQLFLAEENVPTLYTGSGWSYSTIAETGYARWYHVGSAAGKTMNVQVPQDGGFWVYDAQGQVVASSVLWEDAAATLPQDGLIVFAGEQGARFHLSFTV